MLTTCRQLYQIGEAFTPIAYSLNSKTWSEVRPNAKEIVQKAETKLKKSTGLGISDVGNNPNAFVQIADEVVRRKLGMDDRYVLHRHEPALGPKLKDNLIFEHWIDNLEYIAVDTPDIMDHYKFCCAEVENFQHTKTDHIFFESLVVSPFSAFSKYQYLSNYVKPNPFDGSLPGFFAKMSSRDNKVPLLTELEQIAYVITDIVGAKKAFVINKGDRIACKCAEIYADYPKAQAPQDSVMFSFRKVSEADVAYPLIVKAWEVANSDPGLVEGLLKMRGELYYADDLFAHHGKEWVWANHALNGTKEAFDKKLELVAKSFGESKDGDITLYKESALRTSYTDVAAKITAEILRRNSEYLKRVRDFKQKITGNRQIYNKRFIKHIEKPEKNFEVFAVL
jgi:hypothetical protein